MGLIVYDFYFLVLVHIYKNTNIGYAKETVFSTFELLLIFFFLVTLLNCLDSITDSNLISNSLREVFTPNTIYIKGYFLYYPHMSLVITYPVVFFLSHYIFIVTYEAIEDVTNYIIGFSLVILIIFILAQSLYSPFVNTHKLVNHIIDYKDLRRQMTANYIVVIFISIMLLFI